MSLIERNEKFSRKLFNRCKVFQRQSFIGKKKLSNMIITKVGRESWTTTWKSLTNWIIIHVDVGEVIKQLQGFMRILINGLLLTLINLELQRCIL